MAAHLATMTSPPMAGWRNKLGNLVGWLGLLFALGVLVQAYLGGAGTFTGKQATLDTHKMMAGILHLPPLLIAVFGALSKKWTAMTLGIVGFVLISVQYPLSPSGEMALGKDIAGLHVVNGLLIFGCALAVVLLNPPWKAK